LIVFGALALHTRERTRAAAGGALLLVTDQPMIPEGVKTDVSDKSVTERFVDSHIQIGIDALKEIREDGRSVRHLKFE